LGQRYKATIHVNRFSLKENGTTGVSPPFLRWEDPDGSDPESELLVDHIQKPRLDGVSEKLHMDKL